MKTTERLLQQLMRMEGLRLRGLELRREWEANRFFESEVLTDAEIIDSI